MLYNYFRTKRFGDRVLVVTDQGDWLDLTEKEFNVLIKGGGKEARESNILFDGGNFKKIIGKQKTRYAHLFQGVSLHIMVPTLRCNLKCCYCHSQAESEDAKNFDMDKETARKVVDFIFQSPASKIKIEFQGGEPLLNFDVIEEVIGYAKKLNEDMKKDLKFAMVTNLTNMDDNKLKYLIKNKVGICTSLDGPKQVHDKVRVYSGALGSYDHVVGWIKTIKKDYKYNIGALMVTTKYSLGQHKGIIDEYVGLGLEKIQIKPLNKLGNARKSWKEISYTAEEYLDFWRGAIDYIVELNLSGKKISESITTYILKKILTNEPNVYVDLQSPCGAALNQLAYDHKGNIFTCDEGRQFDLFKLGNVKKDNYNKILTSNGASSIISASTNDCYLCDACVYKPYCGLCPVCCYADTGTLVPNLSMDNRCKIFKGMFDYVFEKLIFSERHKKVFSGWANMV